MVNAKTALEISTNAQSEELHQLQLAYLSALELSQFKAGFLSRTSHELRSPLNGLISSLQLILSDLCDDPEEERDYVKIAHDSALKLVEILDQVITVSKVVHGSYPLKLEAVDLDLVLQEVAMQVRMQAENRNLKLNIPLLDQEIEVWADMACLRQVFVMLVDGAIALMQEGVIAVAALVVDGVAKVTIVDDRPVEAWREISPQVQLPPLTDKVEKTVEGLTQLPTLSTNFRLVLAKDLLLSMGGDLELIEQDGKTHLQCVLPLASA
ncbi:HAMP domain-containing histidine kinase [filamentous cyanobacterium LEGE 11480]|uniref:histidine kinase n=1 Tax=Romeriopsis navalis LEGE 11480 TaxID=2777977 RepID=A0A928Z1R0_9CYAN|nr:HAMP domain-containing sensor histidine kinase [Romeriopsis navalis]MBE9028759.1 HAMP domain-containing histidine kinase [Romeriopsis navalis LEGE 11480]